MVLRRRYFILDRVSVDELEALETCIGELWTQRYSLDASKLLIKKNDLIISEYAENIISKLGTEYTLEEIKVIMLSEAWHTELEF